MRIKEELQPSEPVVARVHENLGFKRVLGGWERAKWLGKELSSGQPLERFHQILDFHAWGYAENMSGGEALLRTSFTRTM